jgi:hypothetical protein
MRFNNRLRTISRVAVTARRCFRQATHSWGLRFTRPAQPVVSPQPAKPSVAQPDLFGLAAATEVYPAKPRFAQRTDMLQAHSRRQRRRSKNKAAKRGKKDDRDHRKKGLQYKIKLRIRGSDRVKEYRPKDTMDHKLVNDETGSWSNAGILKLHRSLLIESIAQAKRCDDLEFATHAEIWKWINCNDADEPFSFIRCCEVSDVDPDIMRPMLKRLLGHALPHIDLLRRSILAAEAGDPDAIEWCLSDEKGPLTFSDTCRAAGFSVKQARQELRLPVVHDAASIAA